MAWSGYSCKGWSGYSCKALWDLLTGRSACRVGVRALTNGTGAVLRRLLEPAPKASILDLVESDTALRPVGRMAVCN